MGIDLPNMPNFGLVPRRREKRVTSPELGLVVAYKGLPQYGIQPDEYGEYTFSGESLVPSAPGHCEFYDGTEKVFEYYYDEHQLLLNVFTSQQVNVFIDVDVKICTIRANGPLCIDGSFKTQAKLDIAAPALSLGGHLDCAGVFSVTAQLFQCSTEAVVKTNALHLVAQMIEIFGSMEVQESSFLVANALIVGDSKTGAHIQLPPLHHIHVGSCVLHSEAHVVLGASALAHEEAQWIVDEDLVINDLSFWETYHSAIQVKTIKNEGRILSSQCDIHVKKLQQANKFEVFDSRLHSKSTHMTDGIFVLTASHWFGKKARVFKGEMIIDGQSQVGLDDVFVTHEDTALAMKSVDFQVKNAVSLSGKTHISHALIKTNKFQTYQKTSIKKSQIIADVCLELFNDSKVCKSTLKTKEGLFSGRLHINDVRMQATNVDYQTADALILNHFVKAQQIVMHGSPLKGKVIFKYSRLVAKNFTIKQHVTAEESTLVGMDDATMCHQITGHLTFNQSRFISDSRLHPLVGSHIHLCRFSEILSGAIDARGNLDVDDSVIQCESVDAKDASVILRSSDIYSKKDVTLHNAQLALNAGSKVSAANVMATQGSRLHLKKSSALSAKARLVTDDSSSLISNQSGVTAGNVTLLGPTRFVSSLLSAEELSIYERFIARDSMLHASERISFADAAKANIDSSVLHSEEIESFGHLHLKNSNLHASDNIALWSNSTTEFEGNSMMIAKDAVLRGKVITQKSTKNATAKSGMHIQNQLDISPKATISGNQELVIEAEHINQSGKIDLDANFSAKGKKLEHTGDTKAQSIYLGFDESVLNHGKFSANSIIIHSNLMNIFGRIYARQSLVCSGMGGINLGLIAANNYMNDSFFSLNVGLITPNLSADASYIFSASNLLSVARTAALTWAPAHANGIHLISMLPGLANTARSIYQLSDRLQWQHLSQLRPHEYMPIFCQAKSALLFGHGFFNTGHSFGSEYSHWQSTWTHFTDDPTAFGHEWVSTFQTSDWQQLGIHTASSFAGSYTDTSVLHANFGASFASNTSKSNWVHMNFGHEQSLFSHNINTRVLYNTGQSTGREAAFVAQSIKNTGALEGTQQYTLIAHTVDNSGGVLKGKHATVMIDTLTQEGRLDVEHGQMRVQTFTDGQCAETSLSDVVLSGKAFDAIGKTSLQHVYIHEDEHFHASQNSMLSTDDVTIETGQFIENGQLDYANHLIIKADSAKFAKGSLVNGQKTADEQLFTQPSEDNPEAKPTLNPLHVLTIEAPKVALDGDLRGGDFTDIHGETGSDGKEVLRCEELTIGDAANVDLKHGRISTHSLTQQGKTSLDDFGVDAEAIDVVQDSSFTLNHSVLKGQRLQEGGNLHLHDSQVQVDAIDITDDAHPELVDSFLIGHTVRDASHLSFGGDSGVIADDYQHQGFYAQLTKDGKESTFSVKAKTARLQGGGDLGHAIFQIDHFADSAQFIAGTGAYSNYHFQQSLGWSTLDDLSLTNPISRDCDITVQAASIRSDFEYNKAHQLSFISTVGDIGFLKTLKGSNIYAYSARDILNRGQVLGTDKVFFQAGRNVENYKKIASGKYTQILAKGNVVNMCEEEVYQGQWDTRRNYKAAVISGGTGEDTEGVGLHIEADGEVISDASDFVSQGSNYIQGKKGVHFNERHHTYIALREQHKVHQSNFLKKLKDVVAKEYVYSYGTGTDIGVSHILSANGRNIIVSNEGEVSSVASQFVSPSGTDIYDKGDIRLYGLKTNNYVHQTYTDWWGLQRNQRTQFYDLAQPTLFVDNGTTRIHSLEGNVDARGAYFIGGGDLEIKAKKQILLGVDILDHEITEKTQSFGWSIPGKSVWDTYKQGGKIWDIGAAFDPSLSKANAVYQSQSGAERLASAANLGIDMANTANSFMRGIAQGNMTDELLARYGLGLDGHFAPSVTLSLSQRKTKTRFQTQGQGGIDRDGNVTLEAGGGVELENGVRVHAGKNLDINAPKIRAHAAKLQSTMQQTTVSESLGIVGLDGVESLGASISQTKASATSIVNAELSAGNVHLHHNGSEISVVELDGANIKAQSIDAKIGTLIVRDQQDTSQTQTKSVSVATNGMFSGYQGRGRSKTTQQHSGIHTMDGLNTNSHEFVAHDTHMIGGKISTEGENLFKTDKLTTEALVDVQEYRGLGMSANMHDAERLLSSQPSNRAGEAILATANIQIDSKDFVAIQKPVIHGKQGTELLIQSLEGQLETQRDSGMEILRDQSLHAQIDVPITNHAFLAEASDNAHEASGKLSTLLHNKSQLPEPMDFGKPTPIVPVEDDSNAMVLLQRHRRRRKGEYLDTDEGMEALDIVAPLFSTHDTDVVHQTVTKAQKEYRTSGKLSDSTKHELKNQLTAVTTKMVKAYGSAIFDEMAQAADLSHLDKASLSKISAKEQAKGGQHFHKLGWMWKLWMNSELSLLDDEIAKDDKLKHAVVRTAVESGMDFALEFALKEMAGPMGIALTLLEISDSFYDKSVMKKRLKNGESHLPEVRTLYNAGDIFTGWALERTAFDQIASARRMQAGHNIAEFSSVAAKKLVSELSSLFKKDPQKTSSRGEVSVHIETAHDAESYVARACSGSNT